MKVKPKRSTAVRGGNTFDYWAGYTLSPDDYRLLQAEISKFGEQPVLLKPVGSFAPQGYPPVYDLDGNAAEWVELKNGEGKACGASADLPQEEKSESQPNSKYIGLRVICDGGKKE